MAEGAILEPPVDGEAPEGDGEVPSVFSHIQRYLVGAADVSPPAEDGSRTLRLFSASGGAIVEVNLAPQLCEFVAAKLVATEIIKEGEDTDAGSSE